MNEKKVLCDFGDLSNESKKYFLDGLECKELSVSLENGQNNCDSDMICTFSCLGNYIRRLSGQKSLYIPKPPTDGVRMEALFDDGDSLWGTGYGVYANSLIKIDKASMNVEMMPMPYEVIKNDRLFVDIIRFENSIYLVPENSEFIAIFNITDDEWKRIDIEDKNKDGWYYSTAVEVDGCVYFMPNKAKNIIKIDCNNYEKDIIPIELPKNIIPYNEQYEFCGGGATITIDKGIYFYSRVYNCFMKLDTEKKRIELVRKLQERDFSLACVSDEKNFWMFTMSGDNKIIKYNINEDNITYFNNIPKIEYNRVPFYKGTKIGDKIIFVPGLAEKAIAFDVITSEINVLEKLNIENYEKNKENWIYSCIDNDEDYVYLFEVHINKLVKYNIEKNIVEKKEICISEREWYKGQAKKVTQMLLQGIELPRLLNVIEE